MMSRERGSRVCLYACTGVAVLLGAALSVQGAVDISGMLTSDNHYAFYTGDEDGSVVNFVGRNETGVYGSSGGFNWSHAEEFTVEQTDDTFIYIAAWSDDYIAQGFLGEFLLDGVPLLTGDDGWEVYAVNEDLDTADAEPSESEVGGHIATATAGALWTDAVAGGANGTFPWGLIPEIDANAAWLWNGAYFDFPGWVHWLWRDGFIGYNPVEYLLFRHQVPQPGPQEPDPDVPEPFTAVTLLLGSVLLFRRRHQVKAQVSA